MGRAVSAFIGFLTWWHGCIPQYVINSHVHPPDEHLPVISPLDWWIWHSFPGFRLGKLEISPLYQNSSGFSCQGKVWPLHKSLISKYSLVPLNVTHPEFLHSVP